MTSPLVPGSKPQDSDRRKNRSNRTPRPGAYIDLEAKIFDSPNDEGFTSRIAHNVGEAAALVEAGFEFVTGEYNDGGKIFRRRK